MEFSLTVELMLTAIRMAGVLAGPVLLTVLVVGAVFGALQAATQNNEPAVAFVPKVLGAALVVAITGATTGGLFIDYVRETIQRIPAITAEAGAAATVQLAPPSRPPLPLRAPAPWPATAGDAPALAAAPQSGASSTAASAPGPRTAPLPPAAPNEPARAIARSAPEPAAQDRRATPPSATFARQAEAAAAPAPLPNPAAAATAIATAAMQQLRARLTDPATLGRLSGKGLYSCLNADLSPCGGDPAKPFSALLAADPGSGKLYDARSQSFDEIPTRSIANPVRNTRSTTTLDYMQQLEKVGLMNFLLLLL